MTTEYRNAATRMRYTVGVDVGTGSVRACLVAQDGSLVGAASQSIQTFQSQTECYEQSTAEIWNSTCHAVKKVLFDSNVDAVSVLSICFTATCSLAVFSIDDDEPISVAGPQFSRKNHNVVLWMHRAAAEEAALITSVNHPVLRHLGGSVSPFMALSKVLWLRNNMPEDMFRKCAFFDLHDALSFMATGKRKFAQFLPCRHSSAPAGFGVDGTIKGWTDDLLERVGLQELTLPDFRQIGGVCKHGQPPAVGLPVGRLCERAAEELGLLSSTYVGTGVIDCYAGWAGTIGTAIPPSALSTTTVLQPECSVHERMALVAGTSACHVLASAQSRFSPGLWGPYQDFLLPGSFVVAGGQPAVGRLLQHVIETHPAYQQASEQAQSQKVNTFDYLNLHLASMQVSTQAPNITYLGRHLFFYGDHFGNRTPIADANMAGSIVGLTGDTSLDNLAVMYYAVLEFLALQTRHIISTMRQSGHTVSAVFMSGSLCLNPVFVELVATACDLPVITPYYPKAAVCYGAALIAAYTAQIVQASHSIASHSASLEYGTTNPVRSNNTLAGGEVNFGIAPETDSHDDGNSENKLSLWSVMTQMSKPGSMVYPSSDLYCKGLLDVKYTVFLELAERQRIFRNMIDAVPKPAGLSK